jgi:membrane protein
VLLPVRGDPRPRLPARPDLPSWQTAVARMSAPPVRRHAAGPDRSDARLPRATAAATRAPRRLARTLVRFWRLAYEAGITGGASMVAYNMLLGVIPIALLALFVAGQVLSSASVQTAVLGDLRQVFPGTTEHTLSSLLDEVQDSTTSAGVLALVASLWLASSFWGALDTAFARIYRCRSRSWLAQKRFALLMVLVVLVFMSATVAVPTVQSLLSTGARHLPFDLARVTDAVYGISLAIGLLLLFACLAAIYSRVPNLPTPWRGVWPGALAATVAIAVVDYAFPVYLTNISTIARFRTTIVFVLIVLGWFYLVALIVLAGGVINALRLGRG